MSYYNKNDIEKLLELQRGITETFINKKLQEPIVLSKLSKKQLKELEEKFYEIDPTAPMLIFNYSVIRDFVEGLPVYDRFTVYDGYNKIVYEDDPDEQEQEDNSA